MASLLTALKRLLVLGLFCVSCLMASGQAFAPQGEEYSVGALPGDQVFPNISITPSGGYMVWEDNTIDGNGLGIGAQQLDGSLSPRFGAFRVNQRTGGSQQKPQVTMLKKGSAAIVWQGGGQRFANIYAR